MLVKNVKSRHKNVSQDLKVELEKAKAKAKDVNNKAESETRKRVVPHRAAQAVCQ